MAPKQPSFQFYPGDWLKDPELRVCSHFARGLLVDLLCAMFEANHRGRLCYADGVTPWSDEQVVGLSPGSYPAEKLAALQELERAGVLKRDENGVLFSARMIRDEEIREERRKSGGKGGSKTQANRKQNGEQTYEQDDEQKQSSSSSSSSSVFTGTGANAPAEDGRAADRRPAPSRVNASEKEIPGLSESDRKRWAELLIEPQPFPGMVDGNSTASLQSLERVDVVRWFQGALATSKPLTGPSALDLVLVLSCAAKAKTKGGIKNRVAYFAARLIDRQWVNDTGAVVAESQWLAQQFREGKVKTVRQREECAA